MAIFQKLFEFTPANGTIIGSVSIAETGSRYFVGYRNDNLGSSTFQINDFNKDFTLNAPNSQIFFSPALNGKISLHSGLLYVAYEVDNGPSKYVRIVRFNDAGTDFADNDDLAQLSGTILSFFGELSDGNLYAITQEIVAPDQIDSHLYRLDGSVMTLVNTFIDSECETIFLNGAGNFFVGGENKFFRYLTSNPVWQEFVQNGKRFESLANGPDGFVYSLFTDGLTSNLDAQKTGAIQHYDNNYSGVVLGSDFKNGTSSILGLDILNFKDKLYILSQGDILGGSNNEIAKLYSYQEGTTNITPFFSLPANEKIGPFIPGTLRAPSPMHSEDYNFKYLFGAFDDVGNKVAVYMLFDEFSVSANITNVTTAGGNDGAITLTLTGGSGSFTFTWDDGPTTQNRTGLIAGTYAVTITDTFTGFEVVLSLTVSEPSVVPVPPSEAPYFEVPKIQSFQFTINKEFDQTPPFNYLDNMMHADFYTPGFDNGFCYSQVVLQQDKRPVQVRSGIDNNVLHLIDIDENVVMNIPLIKTAEYINQQQTFAIRIQNHGSGQSRIYFTGSAALPIPLVVGDSVEVINNADGFNGVYEILGINTDSVTGSQYLIINKNYAIAGTSTLADGVFLVSELEFNIYEGVVDFSAISLGHYYLKAFAEGFEEETAHYSEPIVVKLEDRNTNLFEFSNIDNAFDIDFSNGMISAIRVESVFFKRVPGAATTTIRNTDGTRTLLSAKMQRKIVVDFIDLPPYLLEKIAVAAQHDIFKINGTEYTTEEGLEEPEYVDKYGRASARMLVEQKQWFRTYNGTDLGGIDAEGGFITTQKGFIKR